MQERRIYVDARHGTPHKATFALFVVAGLLVVLGVWFLQLRTMLDREAVVADFQQSMATFTDDMRAALPVDADGVSAVDEAGAAAAALGEAFQEEMAKQEARDAVAQELVTQLEGGGETATPDEVNE